jgi:hypothetical protein
MCMTFKHAMDDHYPGPDEYKGPDWGRTFHLRCARCGTVRRVTIDAVGNISTSSYTQSPEYKRALKLRKMLEWTPADLRTDHMKAVRAERSAQRQRRGTRR